MGGEIFDVDVKEVCVSFFHKSDNHEEPARIAFLVMKEHPREDEPTNLQKNVEVEGSLEGDKQLTRHNSPSLSTNQRVEIKT